VSTNLDGHMPETSTSAAVADRRLYNLFYVLEEPWSLYPRACICSTAGNSWPDRWRRSSVYGFRHCQGEHTASFRFWHI